MNILLIDGSYCDLLKNCETAYTIVFKIESFILCLIL